MLHIAYDGTRYAGWQIQPNAVTVQQTIEEALAIPLRQSISITGSGRTDAGVHARGQRAHFDVDASVDTRRLCRSLNGLLPNDIVITDITPVPDDFHARFDAIRRSYRYYFSQTPQALHQNTTTIWWQSLDIGRISEAAGLLRGDIDCRSFTPFDPELPHHRCIFYTAGVMPPDADGRYCFYISANRFLRSLVRSLMGTLIDVGKGRICVADFKRLLTHPDRSAAGSTAPAKGLVLHHVAYEDPHDSYNSAENQTSAAPPINHPENE